MSQPGEQDQSFVTGFGLGLLAGAAGFVLFGTRKGAELRQQIQSAITEANRDDVTVVPPNQAQTLREFLHQTYQAIKTELDQESAQKTSAAKSKPARTVKTKTSPKKFKNI